MRMMLTAHMDTPTSNQAVSDGTMGKMIEGIIEELKPEAAYFLADEGDRTAMLVFDLQDPSAIPPTCEPLFMAGARVDLKPVMNAQDLKTGLASLGR